MMNCHKALPLIRLIDYKLECKLFQNCIMVGIRASLIDYKLECKLVSTVVIVSIYPRLIDYKLECKLHILDRATTDF